MAGYCAEGLYIKVDKSGGLFQWEMVHGHDSCFQANWLGEISINFMQFWMRLDTILIQMDFYMYMLRAICINAPEGGLNTLNPI